MSGTALLFPGQGAQAVGMGVDLVRAFPVAGETFEAADAALGYPLSAACFDGPAERLTATEVCQPAILTVSVECTPMYDATNGILTAVAKCSVDGICQ